MQSSESGYVARRAAWLGWFVLSGMAAWYSLDLLRTSVYALKNWGLWPGLIDAVAALRLGESLILVPLGVYLLALRRNAGFLHKARWVMWAGALLAGISFPGLNGRIAWAPLALLIAFLGMLAPPLAGSNRGCAARLLPWFALVGLALLHLLVNFSGFLFHGYAVVPYPAPYPRPAATREERQQQDVRYLGNELARLHMNAYHTTPQQVYWDEIARLEEAALSLSGEEMALEMMRFVAAVGDAHTSFKVHPQTPLHIIPVDLRWYGNDLHVRGISEEYPQAIGARVLKIGSMPVGEVYQAMLPYIAHENDAWARTQSSQYMNQVELLVRVGAVDGVGPVTLMLENAAQETLAVEVIPLEPGEKVNFLAATQAQPFYLSRPDLPFWYEYRESSRTLYFRYAACIDPWGFRKAANEFWKLAEERPVDRLIIDLRGNGGGNTFQFDRFFAPRLKEHPELDDPQRLFVLIDRLTFSSASDHAAYLRVNTGATLVGEPTGGKPNGYGEVRSFNLPNSRARVNYSTNYFQTMEINLLTIEPDVMVYTPAQAVYAGEDAVLDYVAPEEEWFGER